VDKKVKYGDIESWQLIQDVEYQSIYGTQTNYPWLESQSILANEYISELRKQNNHYLPEVCPYHVGAGL
jgi:hypothetical protein